MSTELQVLVVDDDEAMRDSLEALLVSNGFKVTVFDSAESFMADYSPGSASCLLLDVRMPGMDGLSLQEDLLASGKAPPIILITGHGDIAMAVRAMKAGAVDFLEKPFRHEDLLAAVNRALEKGDDIDIGGSAAGEANKRLEALTEREMDVVRLLVGGLANKQIAHELGISPRTVEVHRARAMQKAEVRSLAELVRLALAANIPTC